MSEPSGARNVGIRDVAAAAGVSVTTVSNALNGKGRLQESTREHVRATAFRLGYRPNPSAQRLVGGRTGILGLIVAREGAGSLATITQTTYFMELLAAASTTALGHGYALVMSASAADDDEPWQHTPIDGAVVVDPIATDPTVNYLRGRGTPIVTAGRIPNASDRYHWVDNDHHATTRTVLDHLRTSGASRIALITAALETSYTLDVDQAYSAWCAEHGMPAIREVVDGNVSESSGFEAGTRLLTQPSPPDAILAMFERLAPGVALAATNLGRRIPEDVKIAGYVNSVASLQGRPTLTAMDLQPARIGVEAVNALVDVVEGRAVEPTHRHIATRLIPRESTMAGGAQSAPPADTQASHATT